MMMLKLAGVGLILAVVGMMLREMGSCARKVFGIFGATVIVASLGGDLLSLFGDLGERLSSLGAGDMALCAFKIVGVGCLFSIISDTVREMGEGAVADAMLFAGKVEMLILIFPSFMRILKIGLELLS